MTQLCLPSFPANYNISEENQCFSFKRWVVTGGVNKEGFLLRDKVVGWKYFTITDLVIKIQADTDKD